MNYKDKEFLEECYIDKRMSTREISRLTSVSQPTIIKYLRRNNIPLRGYTENKMPFPKGSKLPEEIKRKVSETLMGHLVSEETRKKIGAMHKGNKYRLGKFHSKETKDKISKSRRGKYVGPQNNRWKGGITSENRRQRIQFKQTLHAKILARDKYSCVICNRKGDLQVDHIKSWAGHPELRFKEENCRTLCKQCHYFITFKKHMKNINSPWGHNLGKVG